MITSTNMLTPEALHQQGAKEPTAWCQGEMGAGRVASRHLVRACTIFASSYLSSGSLNCSLCPCLYPSLMSSQILD